ncbi:MAG: Trk system potassium transporter TrkA, partial [Gammaproteobacteria bacterium]
SDETNIVACQVAYTLFNTPTKIARIRAPEYHDHTDLFTPSSMPIDVLISPEELVTDYLQRLIQHPGALQVLDFADGKVQLVGLKAYYGGPMVGHQLSDLKKHMPKVDTRVAAIFRKGRAIEPTGQTVVEADDEVFFISAPGNIRTVMGELRKLDSPNRRIFIAGGGNIGRRLAKSLESKYNVKLIERSRAQARRLAEELEDTIVLLGDGSDEEMLLEENIEHGDVFCAVTNDDQANILSAMLAKRLGVKRVMALINRPAYVDLVESSGVIDIAFSPSQATIGSLLAHIRRGDVVKVHSLRRGAAEAIEAIAHGDASSSQVVGRLVEELPLPEGATIGCIVRGDDVVIVHHDTVIESEDHVIIFLTNKRQIPVVERLFQVAVTFF